MDTQKRDTDVEVIRCLACIMVVAGHAIGTFDVNFTPVLSVAERVYAADGVSFFFMVTGFFLFRNRSFRSHLRKTVHRIVIPGAVMLFLTRLLWPWIRNTDSLWHCFTTNHIDWKEFLTCFAQQTAGGYGTEHLWYLFTYVFLILMFPVLELLCREDERSDKARHYVLGLSLLTLLLRDVQHCHPWPIETDLFCVFPAYVLCALAGYELYRNKNVLPGRRDIRRKCAAAWIILYIARCAMQLHALSIGDASLYFCYWNCGCSLISAGLTIIILFTYSPIKGPAAKASAWFGGHSFHIYLLHYPIMYFVDARGLHSKLLEVFRMESGSRAVRLTGNLVYLFSRTLLLIALSLLLSVVLEQLRRRAQAVLLQAKGGSR